MYVCRITFEICGFRFMLHFHLEEWDHQIEDQPHIHHLDVRRLGKILGDGDEEVPAEAEQQRSPGATAEIPGGQPEEELERQWEAEEP